jgi:hypothetical protein
MAAAANSGRDITAGVSFIGPPLAGGVIAG